MPLPKRVVEPVHVSRSTIPEEFPLPSELEAATNGTLANTVRQLSSLSRHAEDLFGELAREAHGLSARANNLQARIDRLAIKVTQLDSTVEEVSLQDTHMRKAFKSCVVFDQQVVSRHSMPTAMLETYQVCDTPPPLDKLNTYRDDGKDGLKFYTDPNYFFDLWRQEMLKDTERMMHDRGKKPHRPRTEGGGRHKKRVRQPHNTRERQREIAVGHGEYIMPQSMQNMQNMQQQNMQQQNMHNLHYRAQQGERPPRPSSIELRRSYPEHLPQQPPLYSPRHQGPLSPGTPPLTTDSPYARSTYGMGYEEAMYQQQQQQIYNDKAAPQPAQILQGMQGMQQNMQQNMQQTMQGMDYVDYNNHAGRNGRGSVGTVGSGTGASGGGTPVGVRPTQPPPAPPSHTNSSTSTPTVSSANTPTRGRSMSAGREQLPPPPPPPHDSAPASPPPVPPVPAAPASPLQPPVAAPPPPPPPPPPPLANGTPPLVNGDARSPPQTPRVASPPRKPSAAAPLPPLVDPRNDLLKAIRDGIKLRKVEKSEQKEVEKGSALHDVASILARRVAVEFSDSDSASESECDSEGWAEHEAST